MKNTISMITGCSLLLLLPGALSAANPPSVVNHQGRITVSGVNFDGTGYFKFALVDTGATTTYWNNDLSHGSMTEPADGNAVPVTIASGHYGVGLGDTALANMGALDPDIFADNSDVNLRIWFSATGAAASFELLTPDIEFNSVGFALNARKAQMVPDGAITTAALVDGAVTAEKLSSVFFNFKETLTGANLDLTNLAAGAASISVTFDTPFNTPPIVTLPAPAGTTVSGLTVTETGFTADLSGLNFITQAIETAGNEGSYTSAALVNGNPAVAYYDVDTDEVKYAWSSSPKGEAGTWTIITVDGGIQAAGAFRNISLAVIDGIPAVAYHDIDLVTPSNSALWYARAGEPTGVAAVWTPNVIDSSTNLDGLYTYDVSLIEDGTNRPAVVYTDFAGVVPASMTANLKYARSGSVDGSTWPSVTLVSTAGVDVTGGSPSPAPDGRWSSLALINGTPAASYSVTTGSELHYAYSNDADGLPLATWTTGIVADTAGSVGQQNALALVNGRPAIAHKNSTNDDVVFTYSSDPQGVAGTWTTVVASDLPGPQGTFGVSLATVGGKPAVAIYDGDTDDVLYAYSTDAQGLVGTWSTVTAATANDSGRFLSLIDANGCPLIACREFVASDNTPIVATLEIPTMWTAEGGEILPVNVNLAQMAQQAMGVSAGAIDSVALAGGAVDAAALAAGAVDMAALAADAVTSSAILDGTVSLADIAFDHGDLPGLADDDHPQYVLADGTRAFTGTVSGIDPTAAAHLATKSYVDSTVGATDHGSLGGLLDDDHPQYLRSNASDSYTSGTMGFNTGTTLAVNGVLTIGSNNTGDDDQIGFDGDFEFLRWDESETAFLFSDALTLSGPLNAGDASSPVTVAYNYLSAGTPAPTSADMTTSSDLYVGDDIELDGDIYADGDVRIGTDSDADDDTIYFDTASATFLNWDESESHFEFTHNLAVGGLLQVDNAGATVGYSRFGTSTTTHGLFGDDSLLISGLLEVNGTVFADSSVISPTGAFTGNLTVGGSIFADGDIRVGTDLGTDDDSIYFDSGTAERLYWDDSSTQFTFTDAVVGTSFTPVSDRNVKEAFEEVDAAAVLEKVAAMPVTTWRFKEGEEGVRHIGPVAQDFHAAFGVGADDRHISTTDADGVALAAIQALKAESDAKDRRIAELEARLEKLERTIGTAK